MTMYPIAQIGKNITRKQQSTLQYFQKLHILNTSFKKSTFFSPLMYQIFARAIPI